jgi:ubiquinone/menaquinone biosynthesis C-methylase UbiE
MDNASWEKAHAWYDRAVGERGLYYHEHVILPGVLRLLQLSSHSTLLDLGCGQGILARSLPKEVPYTGIDLSPSLIRSARSYHPPKHHHFLVGDVTKPLDLQEKFTHATAILSLQNMENPLALFKTAAAQLQPRGRLLLVLNHPCFRIPRESSWQVDLPKKTQFRRIDRYLSPLKISIQTHPSQKKSSPKTSSFHFPLSTYSQWLYESGFCIEKIEEWCSDKRSTGRAAAMENRSRREFPLFLALLTQLS